MADIQSLIQTAAQPQEPQPQQFDEGFDAPDAFGSAVGALAQLLQEDPTLAAKIADLIEQHYSGGEVMQPQEQPQPQVALEPQAQVSPELAQRLAALEQTITQMQRPLADYQLDRELAETPFGVPPFAAIEPSHYRPAFDLAIEEHAREIEAIAGNAGTAGVAEAAVDRPGREVDGAAAPAAPGKAGMADAAAAAAAGVPTAESAGIAEDAPVAADAC